MSNREKDPLNSGGSWFITYEDALAASEQYSSVNFPCEGVDGRWYKTKEDAIAAALAYFTRLNQSSTDTDEISDKYINEIELIYPLLEYHISKYEKKSFKELINPNPEPKILGLGQSEIYTWDERKPKTKYEIVFNLGPKYDGEDSDELPTITPLYDPENWLAEGRYGVLARWIKQGNMHNHNSREDVEYKKLRDAIAEKMAKLQAELAVLQRLNESLGGSVRLVGGFSVGLALDDPSADTKDPTAEQ